MQIDPSSRTLPFQASSQLVSICTIVGAAVLSVGVFAFALAIIPGSLLPIVGGTIVVVIASVFAAEVLVRGRPQRLQEMARDNCYRTNGQRSTRRTRNEIQAVGKLRRDLWAVATIVLFVWCGTLFVVHNFYVPIPIAIRGAAALGDTDRDWISAMENAGVRRDAEAATRSSYRLSPREADRRVKLLWKLSPIVGVALCLLLVGTAIGVNYCYSLALRDYEAGLISRQTAAADRDIRHLQKLASKQL
ncbi:MAG TPA: hypothetical protein DDW52_02445 [Planctomycetaceae bacterium]|nr:hypothetical protein [Planctomycetaceae bacterium]